MFNPNIVALNCMLWGIQIKQQGRTDRLRMANDPTNVCQYISTIKLFFVFAQELSFCNLGRRCFGRNSAKRF